MANPKKLDDILSVGEEKARKVAKEKLKVVREVLGYS